MSLPNFEQSSEKKPIRSASFRFLDHLSDKENFRSSTFCFLCDFFPLVDLVFVIINSFFVSFRLEGMIDRFEVSYLQCLVVVTVAEK